MGIWIRSDIVADTDPMRRGIVLEVVSFEICEHLTDDYVSLYAKDVNGQRWKLKTCKSLKTALDELEKICAWIAEGGRGVYRIHLDWLKKKNDQASCLT